MNVLCRRPIVLALLSSLLLFAASPGQWAVTPVAWIALLPLLFACHGLSVKQSARLGMLCGLVYYLSLIYWIVIALGRYGGLPLWVTAPALMALALYMASYMAVFAAILSWMPDKLPMVWTAPLAWVSLDFLRCRLLSGFPWLDLGYSQFNWTLINQVADLCGHYGVTFLLVMVNAWLADFFLGRRLPPVRGCRCRQFLLHSALPLLLLVSALLYNFWRYQQLEATLAKAPTLAIGLAQGNVDQSEKWQAELQVQTVDTYLALSAEAVASQPLDLLIWPETALPFFPTDHRLFQRVTDQFSSIGGPSLLTGAPHFEANQDSEIPNYFNSAFLVSPTSFGKGVALQRYDKEHLVPFGEYIPLQRYLPKALPLVQTMGNFSAGQDSAPLLSAKAKLGMLICFESIFPEEARMRVLRGANILVNLTNDAWYGRSSAPYQQVPMAVFRAIENRRSLARAANTGISCLITPLGAVLSASPIFEKLQVSGQLPLLEGASFYTRYGFLFPLLCLLLLSLLLLYGIFRKNEV